MNKKAVIEIAQFRLVADIQEKDFLKEAEVVHEDFLRKQRGYVDRELLKDKDGLWMDVLHWKSMEEAQKAAELLMKGPKAEKFIGMIDPSSVKMLHLWQVKEFDK